MSKSTISVEAIRELITLWRGMEVCIIMEDVALTDYEIKLMQGAYNSAVIELANQLEGLCNGV